MSFTSIFDPDPAASYQLAPVWVHDDGGRADSGFVGEARDCVTRAIAIATGRPYREVYDDIAALNAARGKPSSARNGAQKRDYLPYLAEHGWAWVPCMGIGTGCRVHLRGDELPGGTIIARCSRHLVAVIDGVIHDTFDSTRDGTRCVYGFFYPAERQAEIEDWVASRNW